MRKTILAAVAAVTAIAAFAPAAAEPYVDYTPQKGFWQITAMEVDPNHVDDYLAGLRRSQIPGFEVLKRRGLIDDWKFMVRNGYVKGSPNVLIMTHSSTNAVQDADKARDEAVTKEIEGLFSKDKSKAAVAGYEKYRTFVDDAQWTDTVINK